LNEKTNTGELGNMTLLKPFDRGRSFGLTITDGSSLGDTGFVPVIILAGHRPGRKAKSSFSTARIAYRYLRLYVLWMVVKT